MNKIPEIVDYICNFMKIQDMWIFMQVSQLYYQIVQNNYNFKIMKKYYLLNCCKTNMSNYLIEATKSNKFKIIDYLCYNYSFPAEDIYLAFKYSCYYGCFEAAKTLFKMGSNIIIDDSIFRLSCSFGHLEISKWLLQLNNCIDVHSFNDYAFRYSCNNGYIIVAQWLNKTYCFDSKTYNKAFKLSCGNGHIKIAKWLIKTQPIDVHRKNEIAFRKCCQNGHLKMAKWLLKYNPLINIHVCDEDAFVKSCSNGHLHIARWLIELYPNINFRVKNDRAFKLSCWNGCTDVVDWLVTMYPNYQLLKNKYLCKQII